MRKTSSALRGRQCVKTACCDATGQKAMGNTSVTTLDVDLQEAAYKAIGSNKGAVIVMEPSTGKF